MPYNSNSDDFKIIIPEISTNKKLQVVEQQKNKCAKKT